MGADVNCLAKLSSAVGAIDGTSFKIYRLKTDPKNFIIRVIDMYMLFTHILYMH